VKLLQDEREYLADVTERAKALREVFDGNGANVDKARKELAGFIGQPGRLLDLLRRCDRLYGLGDHTHRRLDWIGGEWEQGPQGYPTIWDSLADVEVLADLESCLEQSGEVRIKSKAGAAEHPYCPIALQLKEISVALGMSSRARSEDVRSLLADIGVILRPLSRKQHLVALDTIPSRYRKKFAEYLKERHGVDDYLDLDSDIWRSTDSTDSTDST